MVSGRPFHGRPDEPGVLAWGVPFVVGAIATALGVWRVMPGVAFWDTGEFQTVAPLLGTAHPTGYPTYVILGWLASAILTPIGEPALRMNVLSAVFVGVAAGVAVALIRRLTGSTILGAVAGLGLAATPIVWSIGTHADPHALHLAFVAILLWLLVRWEDARLEDPSRADRWLLAAAAVTGLSVGNHSLTFLLGLPIGLYVLAVEPGVLRRRAFIARCLAAVIVPLVLVYLELPVRGGAIPGLEAPLVYGDPSTLGGFVYVATGEQFRGGLNDPLGELPRKFADLLGFTARQFGPLAIGVVAGFIVTALRFPAYALLTGTAVAITCFFNSAYVNADLERYYLGPALIAWTWLAILAVTAAGAVAGAIRGRGGASSASHGRRRLADPIGLAAVALVGGLVIGPTVAALGERAAVVDRTLDLSAGRWLDAVLEELEPEAVVVSWWSYSTPLWYAQHIEGRRTDVTVIDDRARLDQNLGAVTDVIDRNLASRPVYVIRADSAELEGLRARYDLAPIAAAAAGGNVYRVGPLATGGRP
jgi:hypothetical protein